MLSASQIRNISDVAAYRAAEEGQVPLAIWSERDIPHIPFLGHYVPAGYRVASAEDFPTLRSYDFYAFDNEVWVEGGGWGGDPTRAIVEAASLGAYWAIVESGEFQTYLRAYIKADDEPARNLPEFSEVACDVCGSVHNDLEECDPYYMSEHEYDDEEPEYDDGWTEEL